MTDKMNPKLSILIASDAFAGIWGEKGFAPSLVESRSGFRCYEVELYRGQELSLDAMFRIKIEKSGAGYFEFSGLLRWPVMEVMRDELSPPHVQPKMLHGRFPLCMMGAAQRFERGSPVVFGEICSADLIDIFSGNRDSFLSLAASAEPLCTVSGLMERLSAPDWSQDFHCLPWVVGLIFAATGQSERFAAWEHQHALSPNPAGNRPVRADLAAKLRQLLVDVTEGRRRVRT